MRLAKQISEEVIDGLGRSVLDIDILAEREEAIEDAESIIAAKLEPVRDALQKMVHGDDPQCKCPACKYGKPVLAKLFEDE